MPAQRIKSINSREAQQLKINAVKKMRLNKKERAKTELTRKGIEEVMRLRSVFAEQLLEQRGSKKRPIPFDKKTELMKRNSRSRAATELLGVQGLLANRLAEKRGLDRTAYDKYLPEPQMTYDRKYKTLQIHPVIKELKKSGSTVFARREHTERALKETMHSRSNIRKEKKEREARKNNLLEARKNRGPVIKLKTSLNPAENESARRALADRNSYYRAALEEMRLKQGGKKIAVTQEMRQKARSAGDLMWKGRLGSISPSFEIDILENARNRQLRLQRLRKDRRSKE